MNNMKSNKIQLALVGSPATPKLYAALQLAVGLCGGWERTVVISSSPKAGQYQHLGSYSTLGIPNDASPQKYLQTLNIVSSCSIDVVILDSLSNEWEYGVNHHLDTSYYDDVLKAHRMLLMAVKHAPVHVIACLHTRNVYLHRDEDGKRKLFSEQIIQQQGIEKHFSTVLRLDKRGAGQVIRDVTGVFDGLQPFTPGIQHGALLHGWCAGGEPVIHPDLQKRIDGCNTLVELYELLFTQDLDDLDLLSAFTRRKLQLDPDRMEPVFEVIPGALV
jgi:hypothetical protein